MPEMKKVYNLQTGEERMMYSVDARDAVQNHPEEWSYFPNGQTGGGMPPHNVLHDAMTPGVLVPPEKPKAKRGEEPAPPDGFGDELGRSSIPVFSGETRLLVPNDDPQAVPIDANARRGSKAEQIAESNPPGEEPQPAKARKTSKAAKPRKARAKRAARKAATRKPAKNAEPSPATSPDTPVV